MFASRFLLKDLKKRLFVKGGKHSIPLTIKPTFSKQSSTRTQLSFARATVNEVDKTRYTSKNSNNGIVGTVPPATNILTSSTQLEANFYRSQKDTHKHLVRPALSSTTTTALARSEKKRKKTNFTSRQTSMGKTKPDFYSVAIGRERGIYSTWEQCSIHVTGYQGAVFKKFPTLDKARAFLAAHPMNSSASPASMTGGSSSSSSISTTAVLRRSDAKPTAALVGSHTRARAEDDYVDDNEGGADSPSTKRVRRCISSEAPANTIPALDLVSHFTGDSCRFTRESFADAVNSSTADAIGIATQRGPYRAYDRFATIAPKVLMQVVYVDGACSSNGVSARAAAGYGGFYGHGDSRNFSYPLSANEEQTNNRAELRAVIHAIQQGFRDAGVPINDGAVRHIPDVTEVTGVLYRILLFTDSRYVLDGLSKYSKKWVRNGFKLASDGGPVKNQDLWRWLIALRDAYNTIFFEQHHLDADPLEFTTENTLNSSEEGIELKHVRGHSRIEGNEMADALAVKGAQRSR